MDEYSEQLSDVKTNKWNSAKQSQRQFESAVRGMLLVLFSGHGLDERVGSF